MADFYHTTACIQESCFRIVIDWTYEDIPVREMFDDTICDVADMERRCNDGTDTHFITRVRVFYGTLELAAEYLGSCYASDCDPHDEILENSLGGYVEDMLDAARTQARSEFAALEKSIARDMAELDRV